jgi:predicted phosphodiesterase
MEYGIHGAKVIILALEIIEEFIGQINNVASVLGISGNHDRYSSSNKEDTQGQIAEVLFYMLKRLYSNYFNIEHDDLIMSKRIDCINYIITHGDKKIIKDGKQAIIDYGDSTIYNVILSGHLHTRIIDADERSYRWIHCPSIFTGNNYSEANGWQTTPGVLLIYNQGNDLPTIEDISLR